MAYELHIEREPEIPLSEWCALIASTPGLRLESGDTTIQNPKTLEVMKIGGQQGDAAMEIDGRWHKVFRWHRGQVSFAMRAAVIAQDPVLSTALRLAQQLNGEVRGDEGELYKPPL